MNINRLTHTADICQGTEFKPQTEVICKHRREMQKPNSRKSSKITNESLCMSAKEVKGKILQKQRTLNLPSIEIKRHEKLEKIVLFVYAYIHR